MPQTRRNANRHRAKANHAAPLFAVHCAEKKRGESLPLHAHEEGQLTYAASGTVQIHTEAGVWLVPPQLAAWVPAGVLHRLETLTDAELWMVHWRPEALQAWGDGASLERPFALRVTPLLRALLRESATMNLAADKAELVVRLMLHDLMAMPDAPTFLPWPTSEVGKRVADLALADTGQFLGLAELALRAATSARSVTRLFPKETGLTLKAWRQRARIVRAMELLSCGNPLSSVAHDTGFASTAAFSTAFRQVTSLTPTAFVAGGG